MATNNGRTTLAVLGAKMDMCVEELRKLQGSFVDHAQEDRITAIDVDRLKQASITKNRHFYIIYTVIVGLLGSALAKAVLGLW